MKHPTWQLADDNFNLKDMDISFKQELKAQKDLFKPLKGKKKKKQFSNKNREMGTFKLVQNILNTTKVKLINSTIDEFCEENDIQGKSRRQRMIIISKEHHVHFKKWLLGR